MIILTDTFNNSIISRHRTVLAAARAERRHARAVAKRNGGGAYVRYKITAADGSDIHDEVEQARINALFPH